MAFINFGFQLYCFNIACALVLWVVGPVGCGGSVLCVSLSCSSAE